MSNIVVTAKLKSASPYSPSKWYRKEKLEGEDESQHEIRTWRNRCHVDEQGMVYIPPMQFQKAIVGAASFLGMKMSGRKTFKAAITSGLMLTDGIATGILKKDVQGEWLFLSSEGKKGGAGGKSVEKCMPYIPEWSGLLDIYILNPQISLEVIEAHLACAGKFIGVGRWRPANGGMYGRFSVEGIEESGRAKE
jgi:hypothetical protein